MGTKEAAMKARRDYLTREGLRVRVTGFQTITVGSGSAAFPFREERWCRVRFEGERVSGVLMHPDELAECPAR